MVKYYQCVYSRDVRGKTFHRMPNRSNNKPRYILKTAYYGAHKYIFNSIYNIKIKKNNVVSEQKRDHRDEQYSYTIINFFFLLLKKHVYNHYKFVYDIVRN